MDVVKLMRQELQTVISENQDQLARVYENVNELAVNLAFKINQVTSGKNAGKTQVVTGINFVKDKVQYQKKKYLDDRQLELPIPNGEEAGK